MTMKNRGAVLVKRCLHFAVVVDVRLREERRHVCAGGVFVSDGEE